MREPLLKVLEGASLALNLFCEAWHEKRLPEPMPVDPYEAAVQLQKHVWQLQATERGEMPV